VKNKEEGGGFTIKHSRDIDVLTFDGTRSHQIVIISETGGGKTLHAERISQEAKKKGFTIIDIHDAKDEIEGGFTMFPPKKVLHLQKLEEQGEYDKAMGTPTKIYHPLLRKLPRGKLPPINWYTIPIKTLDETCLKYLFENESTITPIEISREALRRIKKDEGVYEFLHEAEKDTERLTHEYAGKKINAPNPKKGYLKTSGGTITNVDQISNAFWQFVELGILTPQNYDNNLKMSEIIKQKDYYHVFTTREIPRGDMKIKTFTILWLLKEIFEAMKNAPKNCKVLIRLEEIKVLCPSKPKGYQLILNNYMADFLSLARIKNITTISTTQNYSHVNNKIIDVFSYPIIGAIKSANEIQFLTSAYKMGSHLARILNNMRRGYFLAIAEGGIRRPPYRTAFPTHAHCEEGQKFYDEYEKNYPTGLSYEHLKEIKKLEENYSLAEKKVSEIAMKKYEEEKGRAVEKELRREKKQQDKEEREDTKVDDDSNSKESKRALPKVGKDDKLERDKLIIDCYTKQKNSGKVSANSIRFELKDKHSLTVSEQTIRNMINKYKNLLDDREVKESDYTIKEDIHNNKYEEEQRVEVEE